MKALKSAAFVFFGLAIVLYGVLFKLDPSSTSLNPLMQPEAFSKTYQEGPPIVLVTYADGHQVFFKNQNMLAASAADKGVNHILNYHRGHIDSEFYQKHKDILTQPRGAGYWLWKPYFILKTLRSLPENAILIYADSGAVFSQSLEKIVALLQDHRMVLVGLGKPVPLWKHLKKEAYEAFGQVLSEKVLNHQHIWAFFMAMTNTAENRALMEKWLVACQNKDALTDDPFDSEIQEPDFGAHRHDEALLAVYVAHEPERIKIIPKNVLRNEYGVTNFHRHPHQQYTSPLFIAAGFPAWISTILWNNWLITFIREAVSKQPS